MTETATVAFNEAKVQGDQEDSCVEDDWIFVFSLYFLKPTEYKIPPGIFYVHSCLDLWFSEITVEN